MRLFIALTLPENIKDAVASLRDDALVGARWTTHKQWHLTLHFIGDVESSDQIQDSLKAVSFTQFSLRIAGTGCFPPRGKPRVLWAGIDPSTALVTLHQSIGQALQETGYIPDRRPYKPHFTLARFKQRTPSRQQLRTYHQRHDQFATPSFTINAFTLFQSELLPEGAHYTVLATYPATAG